MPSLAENAAALSGRIFSEIFERKKDQSRLSKLEYISGLSTEEFRDRFARTGYPVILRDLIPAESTDTGRLFTLLRKCGGSIQVEARFGTYADPSQYIAGRKLRSMTLSCFLDSLESGEAEGELLYLGNGETPEGFTSELNLKSPPGYEVSDFNPPRIWLGPRGAITPLHKDIVDNFCFHLSGKKRWVIFPVRDYPHLYMSHPDPIKLPDFATSQVDVRNPDYSKFPLARLASGIEVDVQAGETLYLPAGWGHYVETTEDALMINFWLLRRRSPAVIELATE